MGEYIEGYTAHPTLLSLWHATHFCESWLDILKISALLAY